MIEFILSVILTIVIYKVVLKIFRKHGGDGVFNQWGDIL